MGGLHNVNLTFKHRGHITQEWGHDITHHCLLHKARRVHEQGIEPGIGLYLVLAGHRQALIKDLLSEPQHQGQGFVYRNLHSEGHFFLYQCLVVIINMHTDLGGQTVDGLYQRLVAVHPPVVSYSARPLG